MLKNVEQGSRLSAAEDPPSWDRRVAHGLQVQMLVSILVIRGDYSSARLHKTDNEFVAVYYVRHESCTVSAGSSFGSGYEHILHW